MSIQKSVMTNGIKTSAQALNVCFMLDEQGREVQVTSSMIKGLCAQLLERCKAKAKAA